MSLHQGLERSNPTLKTCIALPYDPCSAPCSNRSRTLSLSLVCGKQRSTAQVASVVTMCFVYCKAANAATLQKVARVIIDNYSVMRIAKLLFRIKLHISFVHRETYMLENIDLRAGEIISTISASNKPHFLTTLTDPTSEEQTAHTRHRQSFPCTAQTAHTRHRPSFPCYA